MKNVKKTANRLVFELQINALEVRGMPVVSTKIPTKTPILFKFEFIEPKTVMSRLLTAQNLSSEVDYLI